MSKRFEIYPRGIGQVVFFAELLEAQYSRCMIDEYRGVTSDVRVGVRFLLPAEIVVCGLTFRLPQPKASRSQISCTHRRPILSVERSQDACLVIQMKR